MDSKVNTSQWREESAHQTSMAAPAVKSGSVVELNLDSHATLRWRDVGRDRGLTNDAEIAFFLLDL